MNAAVQKLWVAALRSNTYQQGRKLLRDSDNKYCCLGVLCELYRREKGGEWLPLDALMASQEPPRFAFVDATGSRNAYSLPDDVARWADLAPEGEFSDGADYDDLTSVNDDGASFQEIADLIERVELLRYPSDSDEL